MVLIRKINNTLLFASAETIVECDLKNETEKEIKIPEPVLPENLTKGQIEVLKKEVRTITSIESSKTGKYIAVSTENKQVIIYNQEFNVLRNFIVNRAASKVCFSASNDVIVADKTGDVFLYELDSKDSQPVLLLGHLSMILDIIVSDCGKYIITCDRDEKIRVSCFPNAYNIASFCLGHKEFILSIQIVDDVLVSASGDGTVRLWNYLKGEQISIINVNENIKSKHLEAFSKQMDAEKVDVVALPITNMQILKKESLYIAVSLYNCNEIQLYATDLKTCDPKFVTKISVNCSNFNFCLSDDLFVLSDKITVFTLIDNNFVKKDSNYLENFYEKYKNTLKDVDDNGITVLYKRKFDNVQEYLERKRQRLGAK